MHSGSSSAPGAGTSSSASAAAAGSTATALVDEVGSSSSAAASTDALPCLRDDAFTGDIDLKALRTSIVERRVLNERDCSNILDRQLMGIAGCVLRCDYESASHRLRHMVMDKSEHAYVEGFACEDTLLLARTLRWCQLGNVFRFKGCVWCLRFVGFVPCC